MHLAGIRAKKEDDLSGFSLGGGRWCIPPSPAYLPDLTVSLSNPGSCIFYAGGYPSESSLIESHLKVIDVSLTGGLTRKLISTIITPHNRIRQNDSLMAHFGIRRQTATDNCNPGFAASLASAPGAFTSTMVPNGNILNHLAPFSSTPLLLGSGLMGWWGCVIGAHAKGSNRAPRLTGSIPLLRVSGLTGLPGLGLIRRRKFFKRFKASHPSG